MRALGLVIAIAAIGLGIYAQTRLDFTNHSGIRAIYILDSMVPMTLGLLLAGFGHFLVLDKSQSTEPIP